MYEIEKVLIEKGISYKINSNNPYEINMQCFSGSHTDNNPSLSYNIEKEVFNCFSCGFKGNADTLMKKLGINVKIDPLSKQGFKIKRLADKLDSIRTEREIRLPEPRFNFTDHFKNISEKTLSEFGAFVTTHDGMDDYICIPVYQNHKLRFIEGRHSLVNAKKLDVPKYMRKPAGVDISNILFPFDKIKDFSTVILVEGIFDMLNLYDLGYTSVLCMFGANNFTNQKAKLLDEYGCRHALLMLDGDSAGIAAAAKIQKVLQQRSIYTTIIELEQGKDPGSLNGDEANRYLSNFFID